MKSRIEAATDEAPSSFGIEPNGLTNQMMARTIRTTSAQYSISP